MITEGIIWKQLLIFFFPIMLGTLIQQLYTTVDTIIVGRFVGKAALASVGGPAAVLSTIVVTFFNGLANGAAVVIAQYYGAKDKGRLHTGLHTAYLFSIVVSLVISVVGAVLTPWLLKIMNTPQDMMASSTTYLRIYFMGILFTLVYNMGAAIMRAVGDSKRPLLYLVVCCVLNIGLDIFMVVILKMGIAGAALATVFSQCVSAFLVTWSLTKDYDSMKLQFRELRMEASVLKRELKIGIPGALQACAYGVTNVVIQASINSFGTDTAAGWAAYGKLDLIFWTVSSALGAAVTTFVGQNYGAGKPERVWLGIKASALMMIVYAAFTFVLLMVGAKYFALIFVDPSETEILLDTELFLHISCMFFPMLGLLCILRYTIQGVGYTNLAMFSGVSEMIARILVSIYAVPAFGFIAVCYGDPMAWIAADLFLIPAFIYVYRRLKRQVLTSAVA